MSDYSFPAPIPAAEVRVGDILIRQTRFGETRGEVLSVARRTIAEGIDVVDVVALSDSGAERRYLEAAGDMLTVRRPR